MNKTVYFNIGSYLAVLIAMIDQGIKVWVLHGPMEQPHVEYLTPFLNIVLSWNRGVTFGLFNNGEAVSHYLFIGVALLILVVLLTWLRRATGLIEALALGLVIGGAIGNVVDRLRFRAVVDFIDFHIGNHHWYTFNTADSAIVCGVIVLMIEHLVRGPKNG